MQKNKSSIPYYRRDENNRMRKALLYIKKLRVICKSIAPLYVIEKVRVICNRIALIFAEKLKDTIENYFYLIFCSVILPSYYKKPQLID